MNQKKPLPDIYILNIILYIYINWNGRILIGADVYISVFGSFIIEYLLNESDIDASVFALIESNVDD